MARTQERVATSSAPAPVEIRSGARGDVQRNLAVAMLVEAAIRRDEGQLASNGALVVRTGKHTGRSPLDKYVVAHPASERRVWWGPNQPTRPEQFDRLWARAEAYLAGRDRFAVDCVACADPAYRLHVRVVSEFAWQALFARQLFRRPDEQALRGQADCVVLAVPGMEADATVDGARSGVAVMLDLERRRILICGTHYAGEIKKSVFSLLNDLLPEQGVLSMHCAANAGADGDTALFFGLSGTGKTSLSADPERRLLGDDEHGWGDGGIFNLEGGCYAKCIRLSQEHEPQIWHAIRFGAVVENVVLHAATHDVDYEDASITENTRAAYPVEFIDRCIVEGTAGHPTAILLLTADAFGVLPPITRLTHQQALYHFLTGYTAKLAGTETGLGAEPEATFSACFGAPFLARPPATYAELLSERLRRHGSRVYLVNTGWTGGRFGVGHRMPLPSTRAMVRAAISGELDAIEADIDPIFNLAVPRRCPGVPPELLRPRDTWADPDEYDRTARSLAQQFDENYKALSAGAAGWSR